MRWRHALCLYPYPVDQTAPWIGTFPPTGLEYVATAEGLDGQPIQRYERLVQDKRNKMRAVLQAIEAREMIGE